MLMKLALVLTAEAEGLAEGLVEEEDREDTKSPGPHLHASDI